MTAAITEPNFIRDRAADRARAFRFLATQSSALGGAYAISVSVSGDITLQGEAGALTELVAMWDAQPGSDLGNGYHRWHATVGTPEVSVTLVEEPSERGAA